MRCSTRLWFCWTNVSWRRYVVKHNLITEVYLTTVMETTTCFGLYWPSSGCLGNLRASYMHAHARGVEIILSILALSSQYVSVNASLSSSYCCDSSSLYSKWSCTALYSSHNFPNNYSQIFTSCTSTLSCNVSLDVHHSRIDCSSFFN